MMELFVMAKIADRLCALRALDVQSVVVIEQITPVPRSPDHIVGLSTRRSQVLTVIDCRQAIGLPPSEDGPDSRAAVVESKGHTYALQVEEILDIAEADSEPTELAGGFGERWSKAALGMIETEIGPAILLDIQYLTLGQEETELAA